MVGLTVSSLAIAQASIGVFDLNRALFETDAWKAELETLEGQFAEEQATVVQLRAELEELFATIEVNAPTFTETQIQRLQEEGQFKQLRIQQIGERVQSSLRDTQNNFLERYRQLLGDAINEVYEEGDYDFILRSESVVVSGFSFDVTPEVTAKLNEMIASTNQ
ncbi:MAG: OmpH family outer membrane protein [Gammaproteobacteria bacterium]|nr:OmpH family outer membrane protein [Gammaproteobacteria bacterium]